MTMRKENSPSGNQALPLTGCRSQCFVKKIKFYPLFTHSLETSHFIHLHVVIFNSFVLLLKGMQNWIHGPEQCIYMYLDSHVYSFSQFMYMYMHLFFKIDINVHH